MSITAIRMLVAPCGGAEPHAGASVTEGAALAVEFPTVTFRTEQGATSSTDGPPTIELDRWFDTRADFGAFDAVIDELVARGPACLVIRGTVREAQRATWEMLARWQRHLDRRNGASRTPVFDSVLAALLRRHDLSKPLVRAGWNHALDTWQWMLRLDPGASAAAQMAALLHARRGADIADGLLNASGVDAPTRSRVVELVASHERSAGDPDESLLDDADALSFFSQSSAGYLDYFGPAQTLRKIAHSVSRMRSGAVARLARVRLRADVDELLGRVRADGAAA